MSHYTQSYPGSKGIGHSAVRWSLVAASIACAGSAAGQDRVAAPDGQALDWFGFDVAMSGDIAVVGSWRDDDAGADTGSAHLLRASGKEPTSYLQKLTLEDMSAGDRAGMNVAIGEDGAIVCVTVPGRSAVRPDGSVMDGAVAVFADVGGYWEQVGLLDDPARSAGDLFGSGVAIDGDHILVGAPRDDDFAPDGGALYVFGKTDQGYSRLAKLAPNGVGIHDYFGHDVAAAGGRAVVSAYNDDDAGVNAGAAYALSRAGSVWSIQQKLVGSEGNALDLFGTCVAMTSDTIVVGAPQNEDLDDGASVNEGAAFVFEWSQALQRWQETFCLRPGNPNDEHRFGIDVAVSDTRIVVGASHSDAALLNSGSAHVFTRRARDRFELVRHVSAKPQSYDYLGLSVAAGRNAVVVGVPGANGTAVGTGAVDVIHGSGSSSWASSFCHANGREGGFKNMGGATNSAGKLGRLCAIGSPSAFRDDLALRATGLPEGSYGILYMGGSDLRKPFGASMLCVSGGPTGYLRFPTEIITGHGRYVVRRPISRLENAVSGITAFMVDHPMYAQVLYFEPSTSTWNSTNALRVQLRP